MEPNSTAAGHVVERRATAMQQLRIGFTPHFESALRESGMDANHFDLLDLDVMSIHYRHGIIVTHAL